MDETYVHLLFAAKSSDVYVALSKTNLEKAREYLKDKYLAEPRWKYEMIETFLDESRTGDAGGADSRGGQVGIGSTESYKRKETQRFFQPTGRTMNHLKENHEDELSVFTPSLTNTGVHTRQWIEY